MIATTEHGVDHTTADEDVSSRTHHLVTSTEEVADAEIAAQASVVGPMFGIGNLNMMLTLFLGATPVVAAVNSMDSTAIDGDV